jgi:hypothetical protein
MAETARLISRTKVDVAMANQLAWSPDGTRIAVSGNGGISVLAIGGAAVRIVRSAASCAEWSPDGRRLADGGWGARKPCIREAATGAVLLDVEGLARGAADIKWSPAGGLLALASDTMIHMYDPETGRVRHTLSGHEAPVSSVSWSPDGQQLASGGKDGSLRIWAAMTGRASFTRAHEKGVSRVAWSPDGRRVAAAFTDGLIRVWDAASPGLATVLQAHERGFTTLSWAPDGRYLAAGTLSGAVVLWDVTIACRVGLIDYPTEDRFKREHSALMGDHRVEQVAFAPDGARLATLFAVDSTVRLWDMSSVSRAGESPAVKYELWYSEAELLSVLIHEDDTSTLKGPGARLLATFEASTYEEARRKCGAFIERIGAAFAHLRDHDALQAFYASGVYRPDRSAPREATTRVTEGWYLDMDGNQRSFEVPGWVGLAPHMAAQLAEADTGFSVLVGQIYIERPYRDRADLPEELTVVNLRSWDGAEGMYQEFVGLIEDQAQISELVSRRLGFGVTRWRITETVTFRRRRDAGEPPPVPQEPACPCGSGKTFAECHGSE